MSLANPIISPPQSNWQHLLLISQPALALAPPSFVDRLRTSMAFEGLSLAVRSHDTGPIFDLIMGLVPLQGISDGVALRYSKQHGSARLDAILDQLASAPSCDRLTSYWHFAECSYEKTGPTCAEPAHFSTCPLPSIKLRKGVLNRAAYSLALFIRDVCEGDLVGWIDARLAQADPGTDHPDRGPLLRVAILDPLCEIHGIGPKLWAMILADLLLGADPNRERWVTAGAWMIAVDSLIHNFLHRTGTLAHFGAEHPYGPACTAPGGCRDLLEGLSRRIDARAYNPNFPATFPRFVQAALWSFCAEGGWNICNGNRIDDRLGCRQTACPNFKVCDRRGLWQPTKR
ncbi:hypothetical protein MKK52_07490 [Methylobacterium sp. J-067]|nr:hypothetical protein [Methylobacterium sp. J-067]